MKAQRFREIVEKATSGVTTLRISGTPQRPQADGVEPNDTLDWKS
jgi:hypothetical protein